MLNAINIIKQIFVLSNNLDNLFIAHPNKILCISIRPACFSSSPKGGYYKHSNSFFLSFQI